MKVSSYFMANKLSFIFQMQANIWEIAQKSHPKPIFVKVHMLGFMTSITTYGLLKKKDFLEYMIKTKLYYRLTSKFNAFPILGDTLFMALGQS